MNEDEREAERKRERESERKRERVVSGLLATRTDRIDINVPFDSQYAKWSQ